MTLAVAITGTSQGARDVVQEAFARAVRSRSTFAHECRLETWLWRIVVNTARASRPTYAERSDAGVDWEGFRDVRGNEAEGGGAALRSLIRELPERQRLAIFLRYYADLDYETIAQVLEVRPGTVAASLHKAHRALRTAMEALRE